MKRYLLLFACMLSTIWASAQYSGSGNGTENDPYLIYNETQLYQMSNFLGQEGVVFKLMKDLDLTNFIAENFPSEGWTPVGVESSHYKGKFLGNNHSISGLSINKRTIDNVGLFGYIDGATIQDLTVQGTDVIGNLYVGVLVGNAINSTISNCSAELTGSSMLVASDGAVGAITGRCENSTITNCSYTGNVTGSGVVGGIAGSVIQSMVSYCTMNGNLDGSIQMVGAIAGAMQTTTLTNCDANGNVSGGEFTGGIVGRILTGTSTLNNCKYTGDITGCISTAGVVGQLDSGSSVSFNNCHSKGKITNTGGYTGGIVGVSRGGCIEGMESCSHFGDIAGVNYVGGLIGATTVGNTDAEHIYVSTSSTSNTKIASASTSSFCTGTDEIPVNNCTAIGNITGSTHVGGLVGWDEKEFGCTDWNSGGAATISSNGENKLYLWYGDSYTGSVIDLHWSSNHSWSPNIRVKSLIYTNSYYSGIINGTTNVGGIAGYKWCGRIQNCYTNATVYGDSNVGGVIGNGEGYSSSELTLKSNVAINNTISATVENIGRIYGTKNDYLTIGAMASAEGNRALTSTKVILQGVVQDITDDLQNGNVMGPALLRLKANYVALGWDFDNNWDILETECFPYKKYQAAPPVIESTLVSQNTTISGSSLNGGTVYLYYKDREAVSTICNGHAWSFTTDALQSGAPVQLYADVDDMTPSYLTSTTVGYPGSGTEADPYRIYTAEDLQGASNKGYYKVMNDIDLATWINENSPTEGWVSIGRNSGEATYINGDGHKITGLWINTTQDYTGLFSNFSAGIIKNLTVEVANGKKVKGGDYTGVLIGRNANGQLLNCTVKGDVEGTAHVGGVTGYSGYNTINAVTYEGAVISSASNAYIGGFAGLSENDNITAVHTYSTISSTGSDSFVGGIIGRANNGTLARSHAENALTATGANNCVGGAIGYSNADVTLCYTTGEITASGDDSYAAGLVGYANNRIENSYSTAKVTGTLYTAGLCAYTFSTIDKCYAKGNIYGVRYGAGVVAQLDGTAAALTNTVAANNILSLSAQSSWGSRVIGGFKNGCPEPDESNYALSTMQVSLNGVPQTKTDDNVEGIAKTESVLQTAQTYIDLGWDYSTVWAIDEGEIYPYLLWEIDVNPVTEITLDNSSLIIAQGNTATIAASVMPLGATNKRIAWTTSNSAVATVDDGVVTAVGVGSATITATSTDGSNVSAICEVTVVANHDAAIAELQALVDNAQSLYDNSTEGENIGQYEPGARAALLAVIRNVRAQISSTMDDETIASCTNDINNAVAAFMSKQVTAGEDTDITAYENIVYIEGTEAAAGQRITLSLKMNNTIAVTGFQCDVYLPDGVTPAKDEDGFYLMDISTERTTSRKTDFSSSALQPDGSLRFMCSSTKSIPIAGYEGEVATLIVDIDPNMEEGAYPLILKNIKISDANADKYTVSYVKTTLTISSYTLGDANNDGDIDVADFTAIANYIMGTPPATFVEKAADVNVDSEIDVADLTGVANIILHGSVSPNASHAKARYNAAAKYARIDANDVTATTDKEFMVAVSINGNYAYSGYQFDIILPEGLSVNDVSGQTNATDLFLSRMLDDNTLRVLCASTTGETAESSLVNLTLVADREGTYNIDIDNAIVSVNASTCAMSKSSFLVGIDSDATGIRTLIDEAGANAAVYDLTGRRMNCKGNISGLQKGIYLINGKKISK